MMESSAAQRIKRQKGEFWARDGAAAAYERGVSSDSPVVQIKNRVELEIVAHHAKGRILDAGTGTGRFAIPLAQIPGNSVVAFDYSHDMLELNRKRSTALGIHAIEYQQGDVEQLPYPADQFDSVVSITVVRHFPQWRNVLKEYVRVLKPGGKLIFEMCSRDHIDAANRISPRFGVEHKTEGFFDYEAEVRQAEVVEFLSEQGIDVVERKTYDFLNNNSLLKLLCLNDLVYRVVFKALMVQFSFRQPREAMAWLELNVLSRVSPVWSYNYMIVGKKR